MSRRYIPLYDGQIKANWIAAITRHGLAIDIIRPGYDSQGRRRTRWTQFIYDGVPIFEVCLQSTLESAMRQFDEQFDKHIGNDDKLWLRALDACVRERKAKFKDGITGESPAPAIAHDGRGSGKRYPA